MRSYIKDNISLTLRSDTQLINISYFTAKNPVNLKKMTAIGDVQALQTLTVYTSDVNSVDFAGDCVLVTGSG